MPSFSLIRFGKVKHVLDGIYAVVEERVAEKGHPLSRDTFLENLRPLLQGQALDYVYGSKEQAADDPSIAIPQGFYDWNQSLRDAYVKIKILSANPSVFVGKKNSGESDEEKLEREEKLDMRVMGDINAAISSSPELRRTYDTLQALYARMTNKAETRNSLFPPAQLPDQELFKQLSFKKQSDLEEGLGKVLVDAIKKGDIKFNPGKDDGFYLRQMFELVPLVLRDTEEFGKYIVGKEYQKVLDKEFISQWAATRHTHVGHSDFKAKLSGCFPKGNEKKSIPISPELTVEPLATSYARMADNLTFITEILRHSLPEVLDRKRLRPDGGRASASIGEELEDLGLILKGLEFLAKDSIHVPYTDARESTATARASAWLGNIRNDPDINRNMAIFVPIIRTTDGSTQISYINVGFKRVDVDVSYLNKPTIEIEGQKRRLFGWRRSSDTPDHKFVNRRYTLPVLEQREIRIPYKKLINDRGLRALLQISFTQGDLDKIVKRLERS